MRGTPEDHGSLDYWAMFFVLIIAVGVWMWLGSWSTTIYATTLTIGVVGLLVTLFLIRRL